MKRIRMAVAAGIVAAVATAGCAKKKIVRSEEQPATVETVRVQEETPAPPVSEAVREAAATEERQVQQPQQQQMEQPAEAPQTVYFDFDSSELREDARAALEKNARLLKEGKARVVIEGHCDERGSDEYNLALGDRRAQAVRDYLVTLGVPEENLQPVSYGKERPVDPGHSEEAWQRNRRGDFVKAAEK